MDVWMNLIPSFLQHELQSWSWSHLLLAWQLGWSWARGAVLVDSDGRDQYDTYSFFFFLPYKIKYILINISSLWMRSTLSRISKFQKLDWISAFFFVQVGSLYLYFHYSFIFTHSSFLFQVFLYFLHSFPVRRSFSCSFFEAACKFGPAAWFKPCNPHIAGGLETLVRSPTHSLLIIILCIIV